MGYEIKKRSRKSLQESHVFLKYKGDNYRGSVLLSYMIEPYLPAYSEAISNSHTHFWESTAMAQTFIELGYDVDVISYHRQEPIPKKDYDIFMGVRVNFENVVKQLNSNCLKIVHLDTAHWIKNNAANYQRALDFQKRRGVSIKNAKLVEPNWALECADCATVLGNEFTIGTYRYAEKKIYRVPISTCCVYPYPKDKDYDSAKRNFMWLGSTDFVHKGLDLVLEAFNEMTDYHLYVCGPLDQEKGFQDAYAKELHNTPNIHAIGWTDVSSPEFMDLCKRCLGIVYPSCSEGGGGSVVQCLQAGLIPIVSVESSVDTGDFGVNLPYSTVDTIKGAVTGISNLPVERLAEMSEKAWKFARDNHTRDTFSKNLMSVVKTLINQPTDDNYTPITG